jgi:probable F420-dependent oxidoreductase
MKIGIGFANSSVFARPEMAAAMGELSEANGIESLWTVEHVVIPRDYASTYPYNSAGRVPGAETTDIPDPLIWLAYLAAHTKTVKLATGILILPQRHPLLTAKEVATLDVLSGGRALLGIGSGWLEEEFDALNVPFADRGDRTDDHIRALRTIWADGRSGATHHSEFTNFDNCIALPTPTQSSVPIVVGGHSKRAARRAGELGDGFFPGKGSPEELAELIAVMRRSAVRVGRDPDKIELTTLYNPKANVMAKLIDLGITRVAVGPPSYDLERLPAAFQELGNRLASAT